MASTARLTTLIKFNSILSDYSEKESQEKKHWTVDDIPELKFTLKQLEKELKRMERKIKRLVEVAEKEHGLIAIKGYYWTNYLTPEKFVDFVDGGGVIYEAVKGFNISCDDAIDALKKVKIDYWNEDQSPQIEMILKYQNEN